MKNSTLYFRWVAANALGEMVGLGLTFAIGYAIIALFGELPGMVGSLVSLLLMVATGAVEGVVLGWSQWWAMSPVYTSITRRTWVLATVAGALVAWLFGSLPFTIINSVSVSEPGASSAPVEPQQWLVLLMAAGVGIVAGAVLAAFQALALRRAVRGAGWWLLANALAWGVGMPVIFAAMDIVFGGIPVYLAVVLFALTLLVTGAVVGAVHGLFLVWLCSRQVLVQA